MDLYFPQAVQLAFDIPKLLGKKYIYTSHPWLISIYLNCNKFNSFPGKLHCPSQQNVTLFRNAILSGSIAWHAFPFNAQMSLMDSSMIKAAIALGHNLDKEFNKVRFFLFQRNYLNRQEPGKTISQRDVPGIPVGALKTFVENGIEAVSVGVNGGSSPPAVPKVFMWQTQRNIAPSYVPHLF
jgi:hypothetical protein